MRVLWQQPVRPGPSAIVREVAERHGLTLSHIRSRTRARSVSWPRQEAMYELRQRTRLSLPQIARAVGLTDHTTALHGIRRHAERIGQSS